MKDPQRIVLLINSLGSGGAQRQIILLANRLSEMGRRVYLVYYSDASHLLRELNENISLQYVRRPVWAGRGIVVGLVLLRLFRLRPRVLISFLESPAIIAWLYKGIRRQCLWIAGDRNLDSERSFAYMKCKTLVLSGADWIVTNSIAQRNLLIERAPHIANVTTYICNAVASRHFKRPEEGVSKSEDDTRLRILVLGRLSRQKNPAVLLRALESIESTVRDMLEVAWYGEDDPDWLGARSELTAWAQRRRLPIGFFRATAQPIEKLQTSDVLLLCSNFEGSPNVVLEAMAQKTFVIASDVSDVSRILGAGRYGLVFSPNSEAGLVECIERRRTMTRTEVETIVNAAYSFAVNTFSERAMGDEYIALLHRQ